MKSLVLSLFVIALVPRQVSFSPSGAGDLSRNEEGEMEKTGASPLRAVRIFFMSLTKLQAKDPRIMGKNLLAEVLVPAVAFAQTENPKKKPGSLKYPAAPLPPADFQYIESKSEKTDGDLSEKGRELASKMKEFDGKWAPCKKAPNRGAKVASEQLMSKELSFAPPEGSKETPGFVQRLISQREAEGLDALLKEYDENYDKYPNDLKYVVARLAPLRSMRGFFWRMAPLAHRAVVTQEVLLANLRAFSEQVMLLESDTQWQAYMTFLAIPTPALLAKPKGKDSLNRQDHAFYVENDLTDFLNEEVYQALGKAVTRLKALTLTYDSHPIVFDNKLRFGPQAFGKEYAPKDRFAFIGEAERHAAIARFYRRMSTISQLVAYDWRGNIDLRKEIGKKMGIDAELSKTKGVVNKVKQGIMSVLGSSGDHFDALNIEGLTRRERVEISNSPKYQGLFKLRENGKDYMRAAYHHLYDYGTHIREAWQIIRCDTDKYDMLLDPELFLAKKDQTDKAVLNLSKLLRHPESSSGSKYAPIMKGDISGSVVKVDFKTFFQNAPDDLHDLMPTEFHGHEDISKLNTDIYRGKLKLDPKESAVEMEIDVPGEGKKHTEWRNYLYGRATQWGTNPKRPNPYRNLFPETSDVAEAQRTLAEVRGLRPIMNTMLIFIK